MQNFISMKSVYMGVFAAFVGYAASFSIVLAGLTAIGASAEQAATGLFFATLGMGLCGICLSWATRIPAAVAWSTPGAAFLASSPALTGGFAEAVGGVIICAMLLLLTGVIPAVGRAVAAIPKPLANALLAGVLLKLCLAPAVAVGTIPMLVLPVLAAWIIGLAWHRMAAIPLALIAFVGVMILIVEPGTQAGFGLPEIAFVPPVFTLQAAISVSLPLYLVTMAGQNIPGFAVLELAGYPVNRRFLLRGTGFASVLIAPFGAVPVNMSAITAAMMTGEDAGRDPRTRYWAAVFNGLACTILAFAAGAVTTLATLAPPELITAIAGLALIPALIAALKAAIGETARIEAPAITFLITASGMTLWGIGGTVWGLVAGAIIWIALAKRR